MKKVEPWPLGIFIVYLLFASLLLGKLVLSQQDDVELVSSDYYERGVEYQAQIERIKRSKALTESISISAFMGQKQIKVILPETFKVQGVTGSINFFRPSNGKLDFSLPLVTNQEGVQVIPTGGIQTGFWRIRIRWTMKGLEYYQEEAINLS
ncbi:MAG: hypothetical protein COB67_00750 [SAR324 cluster bacterium]|uniref:Nitrogen fixation protein FixH n=1 Tax=SAR324 cluster bacterium TaxID=2024889 RepID=A0A2A4TB06_9DELT|nr:MAG: hypothetical protein COB67_00750 [SAR324 cluster bacterium]